MALSATPVGQVISPILVGIEAVQERAYGFLPLLWTATPVLRAPEAHRLFAGPLPLPQPRHSLRSGLCHECQGSVT
jgi:hypothetical protein